MRKFFIQTSRGTSEQTADSSVNALMNHLEERGYIRDSDVAYTPSYENCRYEITEIQADFARASLPNGEYAIAKFIDTPQQTVPLARPLAA